MVFKNKVIKNRLDKLIDKIFKLKIEIEDKQNRINYLEELLQENRIFF